MPEPDHKTLNMPGPASGGGWFSNLLGGDDDGEQAQDGGGFSLANVLGNPFAQSLPAIGPALALGNAVAPVASQLEIGPDGVTLKPSAKLWLLAGGALVLYVVLK